MKSRLLFAAVAAMSCTPTSRSVVDDDAWRAEVDSFLGAYRAAADARDTLALRAMFTDASRFEWIEDGQIRYDSPDAVIGALISLPTGFRIETKYHDTRARGLGQDAATVSMRFVTSMGDGASGFEFAGMITLTLERAPAGWQIVTGHTSTPRPDGR